MYEIGIIPLTQGWADMVVVEFAVENGKLWKRYISGYIV